MNYTKIAINVTSELADKLDTHARKRHNNEVTGITDYLTGKAKAKNLAADQRLNRSYDRIDTAWAKTERRRMGIPNYVHGYDTSTGAPLYRPIQKARPAVALKGLPKIKPSPNSILTGVARVGGALAAIHRLMGMRKKTPFLNTQKGKALAAIALLSTGATLNSALNLDRPK